MHNHTAGVFKALGERMQKKKPKGLCQQQDAELCSTELCSTEQHRERAAQRLYFTVHGIAYHEVGNNSHRCLKSRRKLRNISHKEGTNFPSIHRSRDGQSVSACHGKCFNLQEKIIWVTEGFSYPLLLLQGVLYDWMWCPLIDGLTPTFGKTFRSVSVALLGPSLSVSVVQAAG